MKLISRYLVILFLTVLTGCQSSTKELTIIFFSNISPVHESALERELVEKTNQNFDIQVQLHPLSREKFSVLLSQRAGDIYITDRSYVCGLLDKNGLTALEPVLQQQSIQEETFKSFMVKNKKTGEVHLYGLPLKKDNSMFKESEIDVKDQLVAVLPSFSKYRNEGMEVMKILLK